MSRSDVLIHFGIPGMRWGHRKARETSGDGNKKSAKQQTLDSYRNDKGPKRFKVLNAANSAARSHFRSDRTSSFKTYRNQQRKRDLKEARLTSDQVKNGRYRVARARSIKRNAASVALGALTGAGAAAAVASTGGLAAVGMLAFAGATGVGTLGAHFGTGAHYYGKQRKAYGGTRAKYQNQNK